MQPKNKGIRDIFQQVDEFVNQQRHYSRPVEDVDREVDTFLKLLEQVTIQSPKQQRALSTIISVETIKSTPSQLSQQPLKFLDKFMVEMQNTIQSKFTTDNSTILSNIESVYIRQIHEIDQLIQYAYDAGNREIAKKYEIKQTLPTNESSELEAELKNSLHQAQCLNTQLQSILNQKTQENYFKDKQYKQAINQVKLVQSYIHQFQNQFKSFNTNINQINKSLNGIIVNDQQQTEIKQIKKPFQIPTRKQFAMTPPKKQFSKSNNKSQITTPKKKQDSNSIDKLYKTIFKQYY